MPNGSYRGGRSHMSDEAAANIGVLEQRVRTMESGLLDVKNQYTALNNKLDDQGKTQNDKIDTLFRSLDSRLSGHIDSISRELGKQVEAVNEKVNTGRIPNYAVVLGFLTFIVAGIGASYTFVLSPVNKAFTDNALSQASFRSEVLAAFTEIRSTIVPRQEQTERWRVIENDISALEEDSDKKVARGEYEEFKRTYETNRITGRQDNANQFAELNAQFRALDASVVPRGENMRVWTSLEQQADANREEARQARDNLQRQIDEINKRSQDTYNLKDLLDQMIKQNEKQDDTISRLQILMQSPNSMNRIP